MNRFSLLGSSVGSVVFARLIYKRRIPGMKSLFSCLTVLRFSNCFAELPCSRAKNCRSTMFETWEAVEACSNKVRSKDGTTVWWAQFLRDVHIFSEIAHISLKKNNFGFPQYSSEEKFFLKICYSGFITSLICRRWPPSHFTHQPYLLVQSQ